MRAAAWLLLALLLGPGLPALAAPHLESEREAPIHLESEREALLMAALEQGVYRLRSEPALVREARLLQAHPPSGSTVSEGRAVLVFTHPPELSGEEAASRVLDQEIPRLVGRRVFASYGVSVARTPEGNDRVLLILATPQARVLEETPPTRKNVAVPIPTPPPRNAWPSCISATAPWAAPRP